MSAAASQTQIDAARRYETLFVPALFGQWAPTVADLAQIQPGHKVLDVGCGTGILAPAVRHVRGGRCRPGRNLDVSGRRGGKEDCGAKPSD